MRIEDYASSIEIVNVKSPTGRCSAQDFKTSELIDMDWREVLAKYYINAIPQLWIYTPSSILFCEVKLGRIETFLCERENLSKPGNFFVFDYASISNVQSMRDLLRQLCDYLADGFYNTDGIQPIINFLLEILSYIA